MKVGRQRGWTNEGDVVSGETEIADEFDPETGTGRGTGVAAAHMANLAARLGYANIADLRSYYDTTDMSDRIADATYEED